MQGYELVVHVFVAADRSAAEYPHLRELWHRCVTTFGLDDAVDPFPSELPAAPPIVDEGEELLAVRSGRAAGVHQVVARRVHDVLCLSVVQAPAQAPGWAELVARWQAVEPPPVPGVLGTVRIMQARLAGPGIVPDTPEVAALTPVVAQRSGIPPGRWQGGTLRAEPPLGPFAVWEVGDAEHPGWDARVDRWLAVLAPADRDRQLSAWTWSRGGGRLTPLAHYLLHAAKLRYELRVRSTNQGRALRRAVEETVGRLEPLAGRHPLAAAEAVAAATALARLRGLQVRLERARVRLRALREAVQIAGRNMAGHARHDQAAGLFADDRGLADWLDSQLGRDLGLLEGSLELAGRVVAVVAPLVPESPAPGHGTLEPEPEGAAVARLTGLQRRQLIAALSAAYPTYDALDLLFATGFENRRLADSSAPDGLRTVLHRVLRDSESQGWTAELVTAAALDNRGNPELRQLIESGLLDDVLAVRAALVEPTGAVQELLPQAAILADGVGSRLQHVVRIADGFQNVEVFAMQLLGLAARVCCVEVVTADGRRSSGTGFLVGPDLVLTNYHVLRAVLDGPASPSGVRCVFDYRIRADGTVDHGVPFGLAPSWRVAASPPSPVDEQDDPAGTPGPDELDYALVRLAGAPGRATLPGGRPRGWLGMTTTPVELTVGTPLLIVQHPAQNPLKLAIDSAGVLAINATRTRVWYGVNTVGGSSGSPCLTFGLNLVALHHAESRDRTDKRNEGVPIAAIAAHLQAGGHGAVLAG